MGKVYQVIFQDEYYNNYELGYFNSLNDRELLKNLNNHLSLYKVYNETGELEPIQLQENDLSAYPSTFGECFDRTYDCDEGPIRIYGFIYDRDKLIQRLKEL